ncbi:MAG: hypothetical protein WCR54_02800 [Clostridia bacterium]
MEENKNICKRCGKEKEYPEQPLCLDCYRLEKHLCRDCGKPLDKNYPNSKYCFNCVGKHFKTF